MTTPRQALTGSRQEIPAHHLVEHAVCAEMNRRAAATNNPGQALTTQAAEKNKPGQ